MRFSLALIPLAATTALALPTADLFSLFRRGPATCGSISYTSAEVSAASEAACEYVQAGDTAGSSTYPHEYRNYEGFDFQGYDGPFYEFPIMSSSNVYTGGSPGPDRVVVTGDCLQAGTITHTGASGNNFVACDGTSR
jgi:hypothetical protein